MIREIKQDIENFRGSTSDITRIKIFKRTAVDIVPLTKNKISLGDIPVDLLARTLILGFCGENNIVRSSWKRRIYIDFLWIFLRYYMEITKNKSTKSFLGRKISGGTPCKWDGN